MAPKPEPNYKKVKREDNMKNTNYLRGRKIRHLSSTRSISWRIREKIFALWWRGSRLTTMWWNNETWILFPTSTRGRTRGKFKRSEGTTGSYKKGTHKENAEINKWWPSKTTWTNNTRGRYQCEWKMDTEGKPVRIIIRNCGDQQKTISIDIQDTINGWRESSKVLGYTSRHKLCREIITRRTTFTNVCWWSRRSNTKKYSASIQQGEVRIIIYSYLHQILYQVRE